MKRYGIKIYATGRYITWCDDCWYETTNEPYMMLESRDEAMEIAQKLRKHYTYKTVIVDSEGNEEVVDFLKKGNPMKEDTSMYMDF